MIKLVHADDDSRCEFATHLENEADTARIGALLSTGLHAGLVIYLIGDLGAGKTTLVRGCLRAMGYVEKVKSPTYTLVEPHTVSRLDLYHFDFYRFNTSEEYLDAGLDEYFSGKGVCMVEWPDKAAPYVAKPDLEVHLDVTGAARHCRVTAVTESGQKCVMIAKKNLIQDQNAQG